MANPMRIRATTQDGVTDVRVLITHPMETGRRKGVDGKIVAAHFINDVEVTSGGRIVLAAQWSQAIAQNPMLQFRFRGAQPGDKVVVTWADNLGDTRTDEAVVAPAIASTR